MAHQAGAYPGFRRMKRLGVFLLPPGWGASPLQGYLRIKLAGTHLYPWVPLERDSESSKVSCTRSKQGLPLSICVFSLNENYSLVILPVLLKRSQKALHFINNQPSTKLKGHSQLWDGADLDTSFLTLQTVQPNLKSKYI